MIRQGTTPTNIFETDTDLTEAEVIYVDYKQNGVTVIERDIDHIEVTPTEIRVRLTQEETLALDTAYPVIMQIRARFGDDTAIASQKMSTSVDEVIRGGVI